MPLNVQDFTLHVLSALSSKVLLQYTVNALFSFQQAFYLNSVSKGAKMELSRYSYLLFIYLLITIS